LLLLPSAILAEDAAFARVWNKLNLLETGQAKPGSVIVFTPEDIRAWLQTRIPQMFDGIRDPQIRLGMATLTGSAFIDFVKVRQSEGDSTNPVIAKLIEGERPVKVSVRVESARGQATVHVAQVEISDLAITGSVLDFMIKAIFLPLFPNAHINEPFELKDNIERIEIRPSGIRVIVKQ
jgi:hypothetical protein